VTVKVIPDPDVYLTESELARLQDEYRQAFSFYAGTPPTFNAWVAQKRGSRATVGDKHGG
jgi:hypothetical protein